MNGLTPRQADCLQAIKDLTVDGVPPSVRELMERLQLQSGGRVQELLYGLRERGAVDWIPRRHRSLRVIEAQVSPAALHNLSDEGLRTTMAHCAGILAQRAGGAAGAGGSAPDSRPAAGRTEARGGLT